MTIRDQITALSTELQQVDAIGPGRASQALVEASALLSSLNKHLSDKLFALNLEKKDLLAKYGVVAKARMMAEGTETWKEWNDAAMQKEALLEIIRAMKYYIKNALEERREATY